MVEPHATIGESALKAFEVKRMVRQTAITRTLVRRLERLEAYLALPSDEPALVIHLTAWDIRSETTRPTAGASLGRRGERSKVGNEHESRLTPLRVQALPCLKIPFLPKTQY